MKEGTVDPKGRFYLKSPVNNLDGTIEIDVEGNKVFDDFSACMAEAISEVEDNGDDMYVYECRPIRPIVRGKVRVVTLK